MFEINEAFAAQSIAVVKELGLNVAKVTVYRVVSLITDLCTAWKH